MQNLTDEQVWKLWSVIDCAYNFKGCEPRSDIPVTTHEQASSLFGAWIAGTLPGHMKDLEDELEFSEEYKLADWVREFRHERESEEQERLRYEREDKLAEQLAKQRQRRRPRVP